MRLARLLPVAFAVALLLAERRWPLRHATRPLAGRLPGNLVQGALAAVTHGMTTGPVTRALTGRVPFGVARAVPAGIRPVVTFLLLDLTFWFWHLSNHLVQPLWRLHIVHHGDPDLDVTTALRFHPAEIALGALFRAVQILLIGPSRRDLAIYDAAFSAAVMFHHSNARFPGDVEASRVFVTPRTHGIHHDLALGHANFGVVFAVWDRAFGTSLRGIPQQVLQIGALPLVTTSRR